MKSIDLIVLESSFQPMYEGESVFEEMMQLLASYGFRFQRPVGWLSKPGSGELLQIDCLFARDSRIPDATAEGFLHSAPDPEERNL